MHNGAIDHRVALLGNNFSTLEQPMNNLRQVFRYFGIEQTELRTHQRLTQLSKCLAVYSELSQQR